MKIDVNPIKKYLRKPWVLFLIFSLVGAIIFFLRFPNNFFEPNFYAEDGSVFLKNIVQKGFWGAIFSTFNGYYIFGIYILEGVGYVINLIFFHGNFIDLARSFSIASYLFLGAICALPILLFNKKINKFGLLTIFLLSAFVPMPGWDYAIIGTIGNSKFIYVYIAFLLLVYRHFLSEKEIKKTIAVDIAIAICSYTNVTVYCLMPFALLKYWPQIKKFEIKKLFQTRSFQSLIVLALIMLPQIYVIKKYGIPTLPGYLDSPYDPKATINLFIFRPFLYPFLPGLHKYINDVAAFAIFTILVGSLWIILKRFRAVLIFGIATALLATFLFVINRTGLSGLMTSYLSSGPDQFFYAQNLIMCMIVGIALSELYSNNKFSMLMPIFVCMFILPYIMAAGTYGKNDFMQKTVRNIYINAHESCENYDRLNVQLYPVANNSNYRLNFVDRSVVCNRSLSNYTPETYYLDTTPKENEYIPDIAKQEIFQTFTSKYDNLSGLGILVLTYGKPITDNYYLELYKDNCITALRRVKIDKSTFKNAEFANIHFTKIQHSKSVDYCYTIRIEGKETTALALPLSKDNQYTDGILKLDKKTLDNDLVFSLLYTN